jgi:lipopolysaccharide heptosyltransferase II
VILPFETPVIISYFEGAMGTHPKTLVIRFSSVGDIVLSTPLLRVLRRRFPLSQIDYVTRREYAELIRSNSNLNYTYEFDASEGFPGLRALKKRIKREGYDLIVDIHGSLRSRFLRSFDGPQWVVTVDKRVMERTMLVRFKKNLFKEIVSVADRYIEPLKQFGIEPDGRGPELHIPDEVLFRANGMIAPMKLHRFEKVVGLCPGSRHATKRWPGERFAELAVRLAREQEAAILIFGGPDDGEIAALIAEWVAREVGPERVAPFAGKLTLLETAAAFQYCDVVVTNDSGLMHVASAMNRKVVAIFGSTVREFGFFPVGNEHIVIEQQGLSCRPCSHIGRPSCPEDHFRCMLDTTVQQVCEMVRRSLAATQMQFTSGRT